MLWTPDLLQDAIGEPPERALDAAWWLRQADGVNRDTDLPHSGSASVRP